MGEDKYNCLLIKSLENIKGSYIIFGYNQCKKWYLNISHLKFVVTIIYVIFNIPDSIFF